MPLALLYIVIFFGFSYLGYSNSIAETENRARTDNAIAHHVLITNGEKFSLVYICNDEIRATYDIDTNESNLAFDLVVEAEVKEMYRVHTNHGELMVGLLGGAGGAWTLKDLAKLAVSPGKGRIKAAVRGIATGLSGYSVGALLARIGRPSCSDLFSIYRFKTIAPKLESLYWGYFNKLAGTAESHTSRNAFESVNSTDFTEVLAAVKKELNEKSDLLSLESMGSSIQALAQQQSELGFWSFFFPIGLLLFSFFLLGASWNY